MTETYTATVDRIEDGDTAVLLLEDDGAVVDERSIDYRDLPMNAREEGAVLRVTLANGAITRIQYREEETADRNEAVRERLDDLSTPLSERDDE